MPAMIRPIAKCGKCGKEFDSIPGTAKMYVNGELISASFDCPCTPKGAANGVEALAVKTVIEGREVWMWQTEAGIQFEACKRGVDPAVPMPRRKAC